MTIRTKIEKVISNYTMNITSSGVHINEIKKTVNQICTIFKEDLLKLSPYNIMNIRLGIDFNKIPMENVRSLINSLEEKDK